jgi:hypothetical protein
VAPKTPTALRREDRCTQFILIGLLVFVFVAAITKKQKVSRVSAVLPCDHLSLDFDFWQRRGI